jgi:hypothetical protein
MEQVTEMFNLAKGYLQKSGARISKHDVALINITDLVKSVHHLAHAYSILHDIDDFNKNVAMLLLDHGLQMCKQMNIRNKCNVCTLCLKPTSKLWIKDFTNMNKCEIDHYHKWEGYCVDCGDYMEALLTNDTLQKNANKAKLVLEHQISNIDVHMNLRSPKINEQYKKISITRDYVNGLYNPTSKYYDEIRNQMCQADER